MNNHDFLQHIIMLTCCASTESGQRSEFVASAEVVAKLTPVHRDYLSSLGFFV